MVLSNSQRDPSLAAVPAPVLPTDADGEAEPAATEDVVVHLHPAIIEPSPAWQGWHAWAKRALDITVAVIALIVLAPLMAVIAIAIKLDSRGPVIFRQTRCGKDGKPFTFLKFRGMTEDAERRQAELLELNEADGPIFKIRHDPRVTRVGRFIRRTSLDELPQFWNVLRGEMSLVGPRPPIPSEVAVYEPWHRNRLACVPGITGLWQVSGRSDLTFKEMVELDIDYITRWSLWVDLRIIVRTLVVVVLARGAY
jgi:exopolysaccharide biosynthesis polyprenyl glycosylphosphotransferase